MASGEYFAAGPDAGLDDLGVLEQQIVAAHARLAREACRHNHDVGVRRRGVIIRARDAHVRPLDRTRFEHVERLALRDAFDDVDQDHIRQLFVRHA